MNKRVIIGGIVGALLFYIWGVLAWMVLPLHDPTMHRFTDEEAVAFEINNNTTRPGWYSIPSLPPETKDMSEEDKKKQMDEWTERHKNGPIAHVFYAYGGNPMPPEMFVRGGIIDLAAAFLVAVLLNMAQCPTYAQRLGFVIGLGAFAAVVAHLAAWNWMLFPLDYTLGMCVDLLLGWTLVGLVMAAIVRPTK